jgi:aryl-alcohol dehydrogenase-like predicted oxidoreductase
MDYTHLGRSGVSVSRLCLGTMNFGPVISEEDSHPIMDRAHELGINFLDTANVYGDRRGEGYTEQIIGRWFALGGGRRDRTFLATKFHNEMGDWPNESRISALTIRRACDESLRRLQTDYIDLYQMHHIDRSTPWEEVWEGMEVLRHQGKILYVGSSNFAGWHIATAQAAAAQRHALGLVSEQSIYSLAERTVELEVLPAAQYHGLGILPWSPLNGGLLGGILRKGDSAVRGKGDRAAEYIERHPDRVQKYEAFCDNLGEQPANVALAWLLHQPAVTAPVIGARTVEQIEGPVRALDIKLDDDALRALDEIFPGPGVSPEAYAW